MDGKTFSGASLEKALRDKTLTQSGIELTGMVKAAEREDYVQFTQSGCAGWQEFLPLLVIREGFPPPFPRHWQINAY